MNGQACGAKTRAGTPCRRPAMMNGRCDKHGGKSPGGIASPRTKHGRYSRYIPSRLSERYDEAAADTELLAMRDEIALTDARLADVLKRVDRGDSGDLWKQLKAALADVHNMRSLGLSDAGPMGDLKRIIDRGLADWAAWDEVAKLLEQRRRLVESERKRLVEMQQVVTVERAMLLVSAITESVRRHVHEPRALAAIHADLGRLLAIDPPRAGDPGAGPDA